MIIIFVATALVLLDSGTGQDIDIDNAIIHAMRVKYQHEQRELIDMEFGKRRGYSRPQNYPPVQMHKATMEFRQASSLETTSVVALEQWFENHQQKKPLQVRIWRSTQRSSTVVSQVLRGVRATFKADMSVTIPGSQVAGKGASSVGLALDLRNRTSEMVTHTETFTVHQTVKVPPLTCTHVRWVIQEERMVVNWRATFYLQGYIITIFKWQGKRLWRLENVCELVDMIKELEFVNRTHCKITVYGVMKSEGGIRSDVETSDKHLNDLPSVS